MLLGKKQFYLLVENAKVVAQIINYFKCIIFTIEHLETNLFLTLQFYAKHVTETQTK